MVDLLRYGGTACLAVPSLVRVSESRNKRTCEPVKGKL